MMRLRRRLPLVVFILLVILALMLLGFACACLTDQPMQTIERALSVLLAPPAVVDVWAGLLTAMITAAALLATATSASSAARSSPVFLQRFLF